MILEDLVMLGTTVPEPGSGNGIFVCSAGYSQELASLIRVYPLARSQVPTRWATYRVSLERNPMDSRPESWRLAAGRGAREHSEINRQFIQAGPKVPKSARSHLLQNLVVGSIHEANKRRLSLAIIQPLDMELHIEESPRDGLAPQEGLFGLDKDHATLTASRRFRWMPRLRFLDECGEHNLMLRDWGSFELQRKNDDGYFLDNLGSALKLSRDSSLLVGNLNNQRNAWIVISVLNGLRGPATLFDVDYSAGIDVAPSIRRQVFDRDSWKCRECEGAAGLILRRRQSNAAADQIDLPGEDLETFCKACFTAEGV